MTATPSPDASLPGIAHYAFLRQLGHGKFCVVHLARHFYTEKLYAVKVIDKQAHRPDILSRLRREIGLMESLDHPNIVKLYEVIETQFTIYVCMEYVEGWSLEEYLKTHEDERLSENEARSILRQLCKAVSHCHERKVVHRDIKPANILITPTNKVMLIDFGLGNVYSRRQRLNTICGSLPFYSPEIARGIEYTGPEVDIWCLGVVLYRMVVGRDPFVGETKREVKRQITSEYLPQPPNISQGCFNTICRLLAPKGSDRQSLTILERDPWLTLNGQKPFFSEYRHNEDHRASRLSGATLVQRSQSLEKKSMREHSHYGHGSSTSTIGARSLTLENKTWRVEEGHSFPFIKKASSKIRIVPTQEAEADMLYLRDDGLSLLQFLMPILRASEISYYLHSTTRILCGMSFDKKDTSHLPFSGSMSSTELFQKMVRQIGVAMTGSGSSMVQQAESKSTRYGVFSIDIVKGGKTAEQGYVLVLKQILGSPKTLRQFRKVFMLHAAH